MKPEEIKRNIRTENAFRHFSAALMFIAVAVLALIILSAYLKFEPELPPKKDSAETTEAIEGAESAEPEEELKGKLGQFLDSSFQNRALPKLALLSLMAGILCFLPEKYAVVSLFASTGTVAYYFHIRESYTIKPFPNGFLCFYAVFFAVTLCCAALRMKNRAAEERKNFYVSELSALSSAIMLGMAALAFKLDKLTKEYAEYIRIGQLDEDAEEKTFGEFENVVANLSKNQPDVLMKLGIVMIFLALITLVLTKFPRLSILAPSYAVVYVLYNATVAELVSMRLVFFLLAIMAFAAVAAIPSRLVTPTVCPEFDEFDENGSEDDDEDEDEYEENKKALEADGKVMEEY